MNIPLLKDVQPEDIEDETERFVHLFTEKRDSDVVKCIRLKDSGDNGMPFYLISLIEHKEQVDYNVAGLFVVMMLDRLREMENFIALQEEVPSEYLQKVTAQTPAYLLRIYRTCSRNHAWQTEHAEGRGSRKSESILGLMADQ